MTDARHAERRSRFRPPPSGLIALWLTLLVLIVAGLRAPAAQSPADPGVASQDTTAAAPGVAEPPLAAQAGDAVARARAEIDTPWHERLISVFGMAFLVFVAWIASVDRHRFPARIVFWGVALQLVFALLILRTAPGEQFFALVNDAFIQLLGYTQDGARFIFGNLVDNNIPVGIPIGEPAATAPLDPASPPGTSPGGTKDAVTLGPPIIIY